MKRFTREDIEDFLKAVDKHAPKRSRLVIIGGAAATLSFGAPGGTTHRPQVGVRGGPESSCGHGVPSR